MPLTTDTKKVMFEIYRDSDFNGKFKVVYFTELGEHDKEKEIEDAMRGEHIFDGFCRTGSAIRLSRSSTNSSTASTAASPWAKAPSARASCLTSPESFRPHGCRCNTCVAISGQNSRNTFVSASRPIAHPYFVAKSPMVRSLDG